MSNKGMEINMKYLILLVASLSFALEVGNVYPINLTNFESAQIKMYSDVKKDIFIQEDFNNKDDFFRFYQYSFKTIDSSNAPIALEIKINNKIIRCLKEVRVENLVKKTSCGIEKELGNETSEGRRENITLRCIEY